MRKSIFLTSLLIIVCANSFAQISTFDAKPAPKAETPAVAYDSLTNILFGKSFVNIIGDKVYYSENYASAENLKHLLGQRLFFYGDTTDCDFPHFRFYKMNTGKNKKKQPRIYYPISDFYQKYFSYAGLNTSTDFCTLKLLSDNDPDTIYCAMKHFFRKDLWTVEGFYKKIKELYLNKTFVLDQHYDEFNKENWLYRLDNDECAGSLPAKSEWTCTDVTLKGFNNHHWMSNLILVLNNKELGNYYIYYEHYSKGTLKSQRNLATLDLFQTQEDYEQQETAIKKRLADLKATYGDDDGFEIFVGNVKIGFTRAMCREAWGNPITINTTEGSYGVHEQWVYSSDRYLYFENGKLTDIQF